MDASLDDIRNAPTILAGMHLSLDVASMAARRRAAAHELAALDRAIDDPMDTLTAIAAIHIAGGLEGDPATRLLLDRLDDPRPFAREHAILALGARGGRRLDARAAAALVDAIVDGGLIGMAAQLTIERLARQPRPSVEWPQILARAIDRTDDGEVRARLVESVGLVPGDIAMAILARTARDAAEPEPARIAAIAALGDRPGTAALGTVRELARHDGSIGSTARLATHDLVASRRSAAGRGSGLRIGQVYLHAELDADLTTAGIGETGGIATLLVRLGDALVARPDVASVTTISRGSPAQALDALVAPDVGHAFAAVPLGQGVPRGIGRAWPGLIDARRGIRRVLRAHAPLDRLHLRMADVGSLAASMAAEAEGVATTFSLAPDPHGLIAGMERSGTLTRAGFGTADEASHFWFRVALVRRLAGQATDIALFPRPDLEAQLRDLVGIDVARDRRRFTVVPEGIDTSGIDAAVRASARHWTDVEAVLSRIPVERRGLPLVVSVGRMHDIKGMARVVQAWATDPDLSASTNLIVVGGDLENPSPDEAAELGRIEAVIRSSGAASTGLVLAGHQSNGTVSRLLVATRSGHPGFASRGGIYVCGSQKEEFGLAIVEALAAGLPVVVPRVGGPSTYVQDGVTGVVVDTTDPAAIADGVAQALTMVGREGRAELAFDLVHRRFTIEAMANAMAAIYRGPVHGSPTRAVRVASRQSVAALANAG